MDPATREEWVIAYFEIISQYDPFCPYAYGCTNDDDERVVFHDEIWTADVPPTIWPSASRAKLLS